MTGRRLTITCDICHHLNICERPIEDNEQQRIIVCEHRENVIVSDLSDLPRVYRPDARGRRGAP